MSTFGAQEISHVRFSVFYSRVFIQDSYFSFHSSATVLDREAGEIRSDVFTLRYLTVYTTDFKRKENPSWDN